MDRIHDLVDNGRPGWVVDLTGFEHRCVASVALAGEHGVDLFLAVKSTSDPRLLAAAARSGIGFDCSSPNELDTVAEHARQGSAVSFTPAAVPDPDLDRVWRSLGALPDATLQWSSLEQYHRAVAAAPGLDHGLRAFAPDCAPEEPGHYPQSRFGVRLGDLGRIGRSADGRAVTSLHVHNGSGQHTAQWFGTAARTMAGAASAAGLDLQTLNLGGGLAHAAGRDLPDVLAAVSEAVTGPALRLEPGGWWTSGLVWLVAPVLEVVAGDLCDFVVIDAGAENHRRWSLPAGPTFGATTRGKPHVIAGRTCSEMDYFAQSEITDGAPVPHRGDWVVLSMSGYSLELQSTFGGLEPLPRAYAG